jgi:hypothetical protein
LQPFRLAKNCNRKNLDSRSELPFSVFQNSLAEESPVFGKRTPKLGRLIILQVRAGNRHDAPITGTDVIEKPDYRDGEPPLREQVEI